MSTHSQFAAVHITLPTSQLVKQQPLPEGLAQRFSHLLKNSNGRVVIGVGIDGSDMAALPANWVCSVTSELYQLAAHVATDSQQSFENDSLNELHCSQNGQLLQRPGSPLRFGQYTAPNTPVALTDVAVCWDLPDASIEKKSGSGEAYHTLRQSPSSVARMAALCPHIDRFISLQPASSDKEVQESVCKQQSAFNAARQSLGLGKVVCSTAHYDATESKNSSEDGLGDTQAQESDDPLEQYSSRPLGSYDAVVLGGTFDALHDGHKNLLTAAGMFPKPGSGRLYVGVSSWGGALLNKKSQQHMLYPDVRRWAELWWFMQLLNPLIEYRFEALMDHYGPALHKECQLLVLSEETRKGGRLVNSKRPKHPMDLFVIPVVDTNGKNDSGKLSSSQHRAKRNQHVEQVCESLEGLWTYIGEVLSAPSEKWDAWKDRIVDAHQLDYFGKTRVHGESYAPSTGRHYHTVQHLYSLLLLWENVLAEDPAKPSVSDLAIVMTVLFHDIVYETSEQTLSNEEQSAVMFEEFAKAVDLNALVAGFAGHDDMVKGLDFTALVASFIRCTQSHAVSPLHDAWSNICADTDTDRNAACRRCMVDALCGFLDIDMSVIAWGQPAYAGYAGSVREEFRNVPIDKFVAGRGHHLGLWKKQIEDWSSGKENATQNESKVKRVKTDGRSGLFNRESSAYNVGGHWNRVALLNVMWEQAFWEWYEKEGNVVHERQSSKDTEEKKSN